MFHDNAHFDVWNALHRHLKRGEYDAVASQWQEALPRLTAHYDDMRMLYYVGRFGARAPYQQACSTLTYLRDTDRHFLPYRLSIFRYAVENASITNPDVRQWMIGDLANMLTITPADFPAEKIAMPAPLAEALKRINPSLAASYTY